MIYHRSMNEMRILPTTDPLRWPSKFYLCRKARTGGRPPRWRCENTMKCFYLVFLSRPGAISPMGANLAIGANLRMITVYASSFTPRKSAKQFRDGKSTTCNIYPIRRVSRNRWHHYYRSTTSSSSELLLLARALITGRVGLTIPPAACLGHSPDVTVDRHILPTSIRTVEPWVSLVSVGGIQTTKTVRTSLITLLYTAVTHLQQSLSCFSIPSSVAVGRWA